MEYKVIECLGNTGLGDYNEKMEKIQNHLDWIEDFGFCSPYDFDRGQKLIDEAVEALCRSIKDGSLLSKQSCKLVCVTSISISERKCAV
jgi:hypothetical protein